MMKYKKHRKDIGNLIGASVALPLGAGIVRGFGGETGAFTRMGRALPIVGTIKGGQMMMGALGDFATIVKKKRGR